MFRVFWEMNLEENFVVVMVGDFLVWVDNEGIGVLKDLGVKEFGGVIFFLEKGVVCLYFSGVINGNFKDGSVGRYERNGSMLGIFFVVFGYFLLFVFLGDIYVFESYYVLRYFDIFEGFEFLWFLYF